MISTNTVRDESSQGSADQAPLALSFRQVSKVYDDTLGASRFVLHDVSFAVPERKKIAIVGRSGSGKSTLLHLAAGIDVPSSGEIQIGGQSLETLSERKRTLLRRHQIGLVFQFFYLLPHLSVKDNIALPEMIAGQDASAVESRVRMLLDRVGLGDRAQDNVQKLSGGEMQRVAICRALLRQPALLLADEPTGNLDDENSRLVMGMMADMVSENQSTLVYVSHSLELARLADETWYLRSGILEKS